MIVEYNMLYWLTKHILSENRLERIGAFSKIEYAKQFCNAAEGKDIEWIPFAGDSSSVVSADYKCDYWYKITTVVIP